MGLGGAGEPNVAPGVCVWGGGGGGGGRGDAMVVKSKRILIQVTKNPL